MGFKKRKRGRATLVLSRQEMPGIEVVRPGDVPSDLILIFPDPSAKVKPHLMVGHLHCSWLAVACRLCYSPLAMFAIIVDLFLVMWLRFGRYPWSRFRLLLERRYLSTPIPSVSSLHEIDQLLDQVTWTQDGPLHLYDSISYPQTTWAKKQDDCDGFALLSDELLRRWDPPTSPVLLSAMLRPASESHPVRVFKERASYRFSDNARINQGDYRNYHEVAIDVSKRGTKMVCWDVADPWTLKQLEFHRA